MVQKIAGHLGKSAWQVLGQRNDREEILPSTWVLLADESTFAQKAEVRARATRLSPTARLRLWTDDYSNLFQVLK